MKCYYLGLRTENDSESFEEFCEYGEEEDYLWFYVVVTFGSDNNPCISTDRELLENQKQKMERTHPDGVYEIFEFSLLGEPKCT